MNTTIALNDRLTLEVSDTPTGVTAQLLIMDAQVGDIRLATFDGKTEDAVRCLAGAYLRELGRQVDGVPTVTGVFVRNDALVTNDEALREQGRAVTEEPWIEDRSQWDILKVMVEFEHEPKPRPMRVVHSTRLLHDQLGQNLDSGHYGHDSWYVDPVSKRWRDERAKLNETTTQLEDRRQVSASRKSRSRAKRTR